MTIITISRGTYSGGLALANRVAERLGYRCVSRESILEEAAKTYSLPAEKLTSEMEKVPSLLERLAGERAHRVIFVRAALLESARGGSMVYHGDVGQVHLAGIKHVLRVRIIADLEYRVRAVIEDRHVSRDEALAIIKRNDEDREHLAQFLYGVEWDNPHLYDLVLNIGRVTVDTACDVVAEMAQRPEFQPIAESLKTLDDLALSSRVSATLLATPRTSASSVEVSADSGVVTLSGVLRDHQMMDAVLSAARGVEGVREINSDLSFVPAEAHLGGV